MQRHGAAGTEGIFVVVLAGCSAPATDDAAGVGSALVAGDDASVATDHAHHVGVRRHHPENEECTDAALHREAASPDSGDGSEPDAIDERDASDAMPGEESDASDAVTSDEGNEADATDSGDAEAATVVDASDAGSCTLSPSPNVYVPLSGSANLAGSVGIPGGPPVSEFGVSCCSLVTTPTTGVVTFSFAGASSPMPGSPFVPSTCSFTYVDTGGGHYQTLFGGVTNFDGDTYTCSETGNGGSSDKDKLCPELHLHNMGVGIVIRLSVTRSTGAVTLVRDCTYSGSTCLLGTYVLGESTTEFNLSGSLSCANGAGTN